MRKHRRILLVEGAVYAREFLVAAPLGDPLTAIFVHAAAKRFESRVTYVLLSETLCRE